MRGGLCYDSNDKNEGWNYESVIGGSQAFTENEWQNVTVTFVEGKDYTFYLNGVKQASIDVTTGKIVNTKKNIAKGINSITACTFFEEYPRCFIFDLATMHYPLKSAVFFNFSCNFFIGDIAPLNHCVSRS